MRITKCIFVTIGFLVCGTPSLCAQATCDDLATRWKKFQDAPHATLAEQAARDKVEGDQLRDLFTFNQGANCMTSLLGAASNPDAIRAARIQGVIIQAKKDFQQNGASTGSGGSTNLVSKGTTAQLLSVAAEYGALTESTSGQTVTVQGQLGGLPEQLLKSGVLQDCQGVLLGPGTCVTSNTINQLNRFSYSVSFNAGTSSQSLTGTPTTTTTSTTQPVNFTAAGNTISSVIGKAVLIRGAAASTKDIIKALTPSSVAGGDVLATSGQALVTLGKAQGAAMTKWADDTLVLVEKAGSENEAVLVWQSRGPALLGQMCAGASSDCQTKLADALEAYAFAVANFHANESTYFESLRAKPVLSLEYDYNRPTSAPTNSVFRLIYGQNLGPWTLTANGACSIYNTAPSSAVPGASRLRDFQLAAEASYDFSKGKKINLIGNSTASVAYYYQDQTSPAILNVTPGQPVTGVTFVGLPSTATQVYAQRGIINIVQGQFTYSPGISNISIPISFTRSNRTELVANANAIWRGQIGISYDFDSIFKLGK